MKLKKLLILFIILFVGFLGLAIGDETKWIGIGMLHNWYSNAGCEQEVGRRHLISDQQDGLRWMAQFKYQDCQAAKALWIGTTNYYDPIVDKTFDHKVVHVGPRHLDEESETMPVEFKMIGRFNHPLVLVDGIPASNTIYMDIVDEIDETLKPDRLLYNVVNTSIGITMTRKIYAFSSQYHDNYFIYDYVFKNTGIIDIEGTLQEQTLEGVLFFFQYRYAPCRETGPYGYYWTPQNACWGINTMNEVIGEDPNAGDPFRALFSWKGKHSKWGGPGDCIGEPNIGSPNITADGHLGAPQYVGVVTIHADRSASDKLDDPYQPSTTWYLDSDAPITQAGNDQFNAGKMTAEYEFMASGHPKLSHAEAVGGGNADEFGGTSGGYSQTQGFGPYTLAPGDSIHIVLAEGVAGLRREACYEIGAQWWDWGNGGTGPYELPDGSTTSNGNDFKNTWVYTGKDSIFQTFKRAIAAYQSNFDIPQPPPPPNLFEINSGGDRIALSWSDNAESWLNFRGYKVYRAIHMPDTTYELIFACGGGTNHPNIVNKYDDTFAKRGFDYYYYITSFDDGSTKDIDPGVPLESSKFYTMTNEPAYLRRPAGKSMKDIRIVPNPYNIRARDIQYGASG
ncbi:MAG: fibronectin, partial [bacterium (Candidatus Stahlbacteria) CG23_combo_of_CG06-09_8_20_14_all_40_9]